VRLLPVALLLVALVACDADGAGGGAGANGESRRLVGAMCAAVQAARDGDVDEARDTFENNHAGLHALADELSETDRQRAGELLRAKQEVESVLDRAPGDRLADLLRDLAVATARAAGGDPPTCA
jgi:hypothetical protein